ncbi:hypothetical protein ACFQ7G_11150 [Streptomyces massasporeus]
MPDRLTPKTDHEYLPELARSQRALRRSGASADQPSPITPSVAAPSGAAFREKTINPCRFGGIDGAP